MANPRLVGEPALRDVSSLGMTKSRLLDGMIQLYPRRTKLLTRFKLPNGICTARYTTRLNTSRHGQSSEGVNQNTAHIAPPPSSGPQTGGNASLASAARR